MRPVLYAYALLPFVAACDKTEPAPAPAATSVPSSSAAVASHAEAGAPKPEPPSDAPPSVSSPPAAASHAEAEALKPVTRTLYAFGGKLGSHGEDVRVVFEQAGKQLEGMYTNGSLGGGLRGEMTDDTHLTLSGVDIPGDAGGSGISIEATMQGGTLAGSWSAYGKSEPFSATPLVLGTKEASFDETYGGAFGADMYVRADIKRSGTSLTGRYHYLGKTEDLRLEGTIQDDGGAFVLHESTSAGRQTGTFKGVLLDTTHAFGRWTSPRGHQTFSFALSGGLGFPHRPTQKELDAQAISLPSGAKVAPRNAWTEPGAEYCTWSVLYPQVDGMADAATQKALDGALKTQFERLDADRRPQDCAPEQRNSFEVSYKVSGMTNEAFAMSTSTFFFNSRAMHPGTFSAACFVANLDKGTVTRTVAKLLSPAARAKVEAIAVKGLEGMVDKDLAKPSVVSDTTLLCVNGDRLVVRYLPYENRPSRRDPGDPHRACGCRTPREGDRPGAFLPLKSRPGSARPFCDRPAATLRAVVRAATDAAEQGAGADGAPVPGCARHGAPRHSAGIVRRAGVVPTRGTRSSCFRSARRASRHTQHPGRAS